VCVFYIYLENYRCGHACKQLLVLHLSVIGDEILKGHVHDTNSYFIAKTLYKLGLKVDKVSTRKY
jgi:hypothetical protein